MELTDYERLYILRIRARAASEKMRLVSDEIYDCTRDRPGEMPDPEQMADWLNRSALASDTIQGIRADIAELTQGVWG